MDVINIRVFKDFVNQTSYMNNRPYNVEFDFSLTRGDSLEYVEVTFKLLTNTTVQMEGQLYFSSGANTANTIGKFNPSSCIMDLIFIFPKSTNSDCVPEYPTSISKDCYLKGDLVSMLEKEVLSDVVLKCDSETLKAHKSVLSARSSVFEAMFNSPMQERETDMVVIKDMSPTTFRSMMYFIYGGEVEIASMTSACDLLYAAEKYQLKGLKQVCSDYLKSVLTSENSIQVLEIADLYDGQLKRHALAVVKDHFGDLENTRDWKELKLKKPALALEVYSSEE